MPQTMQETRESGEEAARAVAEMRHLAIDDWGQVSRFTRAALAENGLSYREQERHTGVGAPTVYQMALGSAVGVRAVQQFAAFAVYSTRRADTRAFWAGLLTRLHPPDRGAVAAHGVGDSSPADAAALYARLTLPASREAVMDLLRSLQAAETAAAAALRECDCPPLDRPAAAVSQAPR
ncbi:MAG: hypothetical protein H7Z41_00625 [Cytophagales bacterium]|nr:hypothetical protein [Armatimonadota bacterium]